MGVHDNNYGHKVSNREKSLREECIDNLPIFILTAVGLGVAGFHFGGVWGLLLGIFLAVLFNGAAAYRSIN